MLNVVVRGAARKLGVSFVLSMIRDAAEGRRGERAKRLYWTIAGIKTELGFLLSIAATAAAAAGMIDTAAWIGGAAGLLISLGLVDKGWREQLPTWLTDNLLFRVLGRNAANVGLVLGVAWYIVDQQACGVWCDRAELGLISFGAVLAQLGLMKASVDTPAPRLPWREPIVDRDEFLKP